MMAAPVELVADLLEVEAADRTEAIVVAKRAAARGDGPVDIGTGKSRVDTDLVHRSAEALAQQAAEWRISLQWTTLDVGARHASPELETKIAYPVLLHSTARELVMLFGRGMPRPYL